MNAAVYSIDPQRIEKEGLGIPKIDCLLEFRPAVQWTPLDRKIIDSLGAILGEPVMPIAGEAEVQRVAGEISVRWPESTSIPVESGKEHSEPNSNQW
jgi:hypothetical protein